ncbi:MAG TPA: DNA-3-methyladenine glycosylase I [Acidobacteriaceae bacterium]|jgi:DNA-3-methyladenine glycosylase I
MTTTRTKEKLRCSWAQNDPLMREYHDQEWGVPEYDSRALWELLMLEGFQAGLSWIVVLRKREAFQASFHQFNPKKVASMKEDEIRRLLEDPRIIRSRAKIEATIAAARIFLEMDAAGESLSDFVWSFVEGKPIQNSGPVPSQTEHSAAMSKALKKRGFKFVGPTIVYAFMQAAGMVNDHAETCFRRTPVEKLGKVKRKA